MPNVLTADDVAQYQRDGYVFPVDALSGDEARGYLAALADFEARHGVAPGVAIRNKGHLKFRPFYELIFDTRILDAVEDVLGPNILCWGSSLFDKKAKDPGFVAWHQDSYYWGLEPDDVVTAWIALTPSNAANGAMRIVPASHRRQHKHAASPEDSANMLFTKEEIAVEVNEDEAVTLELAPGEMSLHHVKIVHGSPANLSSEDRVGYAIRYVSPAVRQRGEFASATLVRGQDDYGHFAPDPIPARDMDPEIVAFVDAPLGGVPGAAEARAAARRLNAGVDKEQSAGE